MWEWGAGGRGGKAFGNEKLIDLRSQGVDIIEMRLKQINKQKYRKHVSQEANPRCLRNDQLVGRRVTAGRRDSQALLITHTYMSNM